VMTTVLPAALIGMLVLTVFIEPLRTFFDFVDVKLGDWILVAAASVAALAGQFTLSRYWQQILDLLTAAPKKDEALRGRAV